MESPIQYIDLLPSLLSPAIQQTFACLDSLNQATLTAIYWLSFLLAWAIEPSDAAIPLSPDMSKALGKAIEPVLVETAFAGMISVWLLCAVVLITLGTFTWARFLNSPGR